LAALGVTTVYLSPDPSSVIGCRGAVVKTGGDGATRVIRERSDLKVSLGPEGWIRGERNRGPRGFVDYRARRPTTRMGMAWVFRKAFFDAQAALERIDRGETTLEDLDPAQAALVRVLRKEIPLRIQAREDIDIWSALRLCREFDLTCVLEEGTEAYRCLSELKAAQTPVIFGPVFADGSAARRITGQYLRPCRNTAGLLHEAGIPLALTAGPLEGDEGLALQASLALRYGLPFEAALDAVTREPARLLGVSDRMGELKPGFDADLVLWSEQPFQTRARPLLVMIQGKVVFQDPQGMVSSHEKEGPSASKEISG